MSLSPPVPGLRHIHHDSRSSDKVTLSVPPGEHLFVSDVVADQLVASSQQFRDATDQPADQPAVDLDEMTVADLREHADANGVDLAGATRKADIIAAITGEPSSSDD